MARTLNYIVLLSIVAVIVAASGCASTPTNNTQVPATPVTTPATITATPSETPVTPVETPSVTTTPLTGETKNETPIVGGFNATPIDNGNLQITPSTNVTSTDINGTHISTTQKNLQIEQANAGVISTVSNGTVTVTVSKPSYGLATNPFSTAKKNTNPLNTTGNNAPITANSGTLKIIPANGTTSTGNQTAIHLGTAQRNAQLIIDAQNAKGSGSGSGTAQNVTGK